MLKTRASVDASVTSWEKVTVTAKTFELAETMMILQRSTVDGMLYYAGSSRQRETVQCTQCKRKMKERKNKDKEMRLEADIGWIKIQLYRRSSSWRHVPRNEGRFIKNSAFTTARDVDQILIRYWSFLFSSYLLIYYTIYYPMWSIIFYSIMATILSSFLYTNTGTRKKKI